MTTPHSIDYETERRRIEEEHLRDLALLEAARQAKLAALEAMRVAEARRAEALAAPVPPPAPAGKARRPRAKNYAAFDAVVAAIDKVGDVFDRNDLLRVMDSPPERSSLYKALGDLLEQRLIRVEEQGSGRAPARYRLLVDRSRLPRP